MSRQPITSNAAAILMNERLRVSAIVESSDGLLRPAAAMQLALRTSLSSVEAVDLLKTMPVSNPYSAAMDREGTINLSSIGGSTVGVPEDKKAKRLAELSANIGPMKRTV